MRHMTDVSLPNFLVFRALQSWFEMLVYIKSVTLPTMLSWGDVLAHDTIHLIVMSNLLGSKMANLVLWLCRQNLDNSCHRGHLRCKCGSSEISLWTCGYVPLCTEIVFWVWYHWSNFCIYFCVSVYTVKRSVFKGVVVLYDWGYLCVTCLN